MLQPKVTDWLSGYKNKTHIYMLFTQDSLHSQGYIQTKSERMEEDIACKETSKESRSSNTISDKIDFKIKKITRDKGHYLIIKGSIQEDLTIINICAPNIGTPQYRRQLLSAINGKINSNTIIVGDFNSPLTSRDKSSRQRINKETPALNYTLDQIDLTDIYRTFHLKAEKYTFFSSAHGTFSRIDHILGYRSRLDL